ncbi:hypothetical protein HYH03_001489 [Edaphochlamys debaryana]|uniref:Uncharacterized protein n=1 Tax=Edaphochlamys debaryana TaxID=47281 RepID=A0A836C5B5_9CHLO|nr:hypothetical protein HYH03_001489 [Edaphochlamys debaryana]|eukprot:KAG2500725.1 hypothetical protein HYH03_001489 [Edaphochlamys debaryana]
MTSQVEAHKHNNNARKGLLVAIVLWQGILTLVLVLVFVHRVKRPDHGSDAGNLASDAAVLRAAYTRTAVPTGEASAAGRAATLAGQDLADAQAWDSSSLGQELRSDVIKRFWTPTTAQAGDRSVEALRERVLDHLLSDGFAWPDASAPHRGIVMPTGGRHYLSQALVALRAMRHQHKCNMTIQLVWCGADEMDDQVFEFLREEFKPLLGYDACNLLMQPSHWYKGPSKGFNLKAFALLAAPFKEVLLWDSDLVPTGCPDDLFESDEFRRYGNMFWPDVYNGQALYDLNIYKALGLQDEVHDLLLSRKGSSARHCESGAMMVDRTRHLDMLEWAWWLNSMGKDVTYKYVYGDKDTFGVAFAMAGKPTAYYQVPIPPSGVWTQDSRLGWNPEVGQMQRQGHWWMHALVHYSPSGRALWSHRVTGEMYIDAKPPTDEIITPPMPISWTEYHMSWGPSDGSAQFPAILVLDYNLTYLHAISATTPATPGCPPLVWAAYWHMRTHAVPVAVNTTLEELCCGGGAGAGWHHGVGIWTGLRSWATGGGSDVGAGGGAAAAGGSVAAGHHPCWGAAGDRPHLLGINEAWETMVNYVNDSWGPPPQPLWAVPLNVTTAWSTWTAMSDAWHWAHGRGELEWLTKKPEQRKKEAEERKKAEETRRQKEVEDKKRRELQQRQKELDRQEGARQRKMRKAKAAGSGAGASDSGKAGGGQEENDGGGEEGGEDEEEEGQAEEDEEAEGGGADEEADGEEGEEGEGDGAAGGTGSEGGGGQGRRQLAAGGEAGGEGEDQAAAQRHAARRARLTGLFLRMQAKSGR